MDSGFATRLEADGDLVVQTHWGDTTPEMMRRSGVELIENLNISKATRVLSLVSESLVAFGHGDLITAIEHVHQECPFLRRIAYHIDPGRHDVEEMLIKTVAWNLGIEVGVFSTEADARAFLTASSGGRPS